VARILLIDDDDDLSHFLHDALEERGHRVECLERAEQGPGLLAGGAFDLVLLDNRMPGMSGIEFLDALRQRGIVVPVILMTGYATTDTAIQAMNLGAHDYVIKPDDLQSLLTELERPLAEALALGQPGGEVRLPTAPLRAPAAPLDGPMLVGKSRPMVEVYKLIGRFAGSNDAVLIHGETGTGKELVARALHTNSPRKNRPFVALNCTALNETLLDDELFGHEPGAFTGADKLRKGKLEHANGGTLFLDEMGDMPLPLQAKLLRVLEYQEVSRIGSNDVHRVDVRLLSATHQDLEAAIVEGTFRRDLFHRLNRVTIRLPPLRERLADLPELAAYFLARAAASAGRPPPSLAESALERLRAYRWPGNVRELQNVLCRAFGVCRGAEVLPAHLDLASDAAGAAAAGPADAAAAAAALGKVIRWAWQSRQQGVWPFCHDLVERELLAFALAELGGNQSQVAERLGMARGTVIKRVQEYGL
jgi:DNA-binding NtrC family response regulator